MNLPDSAQAPTPSDIVVTDDPFDARLALNAAGVLRQFNDAGIITAADVLVATRLAELAGETTESVRLAVALAVRGVRSGSVCVDLEQLRAQLSVFDGSLAWPAVTVWLAALEASPLLGPGKPLRLEYGLLYLERYRRQEEQVRQDLLTREKMPPPVVDPDVLARGLHRLFPAADSELQRRAAEIAATSWTTVLGGGPGTGKTTTVARILALLLDQPEPPLRIALAAPTGKASARLQAAVQGEARTFATSDRHDLPKMTASTLHRLLGWVPGGGARFRHNRDNRLPFDMVVVDETSMVSLTMMARLLEALRPDTRLLLVGDPDQLASVEAGAVLADLVAGLNRRDSTGVVLLRKTWRFDGDIADLAAAVRDGDADSAIEVLRRGSPAVALVDHDDAGIRDDVVGAATVLRQSALQGDARTALQDLDRHRLLCAHRTGPRGVQEWTRRIENWIAEVHVDLGVGEWYAGRPVLVMANDYALGLFNGDTGVAITENGADLRVVFTREGEPVSYAPRRLSEVQTVHAMTVHRSQGSQFDRVTFVLPEEDSPLSTRELLYTALTRAQSFVRLVGTEQELRAAVSQPAARASGLQLRLSES